MFDEAQLRSFSVVARTRHFGRAARQLFITQPALTRRIQQLEMDVGAPLFRREGRGVDLTAAGLAFLPEADAILAHMEAARRIAQKAGGTLAGKLLIGFDGAASYMVIPQLIERVMRMWPQLELEFSEHGSIAQMQELSFHRLDIGIIRPLPHGSDIISEPIFREPLALAVPVGHRLAGKRKPALRDLEGEAFVAYSEAGRYLRDVIDAELQGAAVAPRIVQRMSRTHSILALVSTGLGVAIVPAGSAAAAFDNILFKPLPIETLVEWHAARHVQPGSDLAMPLIELLRGMLG